MAEQLYRKSRIQGAAPSNNVDDLVSKNVLAQLRRDPPPRPPPAAHDVGKAGSKPAGGVSCGGGVGRGDPVEASDLISSMAKRLAALERDMKERQVALQAVQADNVALKSKLKVAEEEIAKRALAALDGPRDDAPAVMHLRSENARLRAQLKYAWKQVAEMKGFLNDYGMVWVGEPEAEAELAAHGYGPTGTEVSGGSAGPSSSGQGHLQPLSAEPSDSGAPRRRSHSGASAGPLSAGWAGGPVHVGPGVGRLLGGGSRSHGPGQAGGLSSAAAAALSRAGAGHAAGEESAAAGSSSSGSATSATALAKRASSFTANSAAAAGTGSAGHSAPLAAPGPRPSTSSNTTTHKAAPAGFSAGGSGGPGPSRPPLPVSLSALQAKVDELNDLAGDGCGQIVKDGAGQHVLATRDPVNLVIYRDGLQIHVLPAKPFNDPASANVLRDVMDGYFPYVLKRDFPDGVPLRVVDRTHESIDSSPSRRQGPSGGAGGASAARAGGGGAGGGGNVRTWDEIDVAGGSGGGPAPESRDKFLSRLPQAVIKNGKVIEIRSDISKMMGGPGSGSGHEPGKGDVSLVSTPVDALLSTMQRNHVGPSLPPPSREGVPPATEVTTLQVKSMDGKQTFILKFRYDDTIGALRTALNAHHAKSGHAGTAYEIRSAFPARAYADESETLRAAGFIPNGTLFLRPV
ncbi:hypothetical protein HYH02_009510 [Chlamydomonas schloesseri]|uniref:UBX domain-containing protein n=1 Tax=Chlamydomonas schloesseri TaxID=2026947 RepID=A0A835W9Y4_9CHLO|nr:hypothetical protein HYH02_009510 [Chlamydomonas schloesseri]|eukprot:KAG2443096.1 hypothetical protein HYH02_009510 [Chlamydomonas schloesseri]